MFDFFNQPGIIKFSQGPFHYIWHAHGFSVQDYLTLSNDSVFQLPYFISNVPLPNYIHLYQIFRGVCIYFLTAVNLSFSLRTLAKKHTSIWNKTRFLFSHWFTINYLVSTSHRLCCFNVSFLLRIFPNLLLVCHHKFELNQNFFFQEQSVKIEDIKF